MSTFFSGGNVIVERVPYSTCDTNATYPTMREQTERRKRHYCRLSHTSVSGQSAEDLHPLSFADFAVMFAACCCLLAPLLRAAPTPFHFVAMQSIFKRDASSWRLRSSKQENQKQWTPIPRKETRKTRILTSSRFKLDPKIGCSERI